MLESPPETPELSAPASPPPSRTWNLGDALLIIAMYLVAVVLGSLFAAGVAHALHDDVKATLKDPLILLGVQLAAYLIAFFCARVVVGLKTGRPFFPSIDWNPPAISLSLQLLFAGVVMALFVLTTSLVLPVPKGLPVEKFFQTRSSAMSSMIFATLVAPIAEEIYFRGILWGGFLSTLAEEQGRRRLGAALFAVTAIFATLAAYGHGSAYMMFAPILLVLALLLLTAGPGVNTFAGSQQRAAAVVLTALVFAFVHGAQLANSWVPLLVMLVVGLVLTTVRAAMNSVAASWLLHTGYNGTLFAMMWAQTEGFRKLGG